MEHLEPTSLSDPETYLCSRRFSQSIKCRKTGKRVTFADLGDPDGIPLLMLTPSGCSRWFAIPQATKYGIRIIAVDRPGVGGTDAVPLSDRIEMSCQMIVSVLEHLEISIRHVVAHSAGIYYLLYLLNHHPAIFTDGLAIPPWVYLVAPWSPILPNSHPDYYFSPLAWIPPQLIETQHLTLPALLTLAKSATSAWSFTSSTFRNGLSLAKAALFNDDPSPDPPETSSSKGILQEGSSHVDLETPDRPSTDIQEDSQRLWGDFPCCIGCTTTEYFQAESTQGVGQEHLICLNHGADDTGFEWFESALSQLSRSLKVAQSDSKGSLEHRLDVQLWWGLQDGMVPRKGQLWLNKAFKRFQEEIKLELHEIQDGDHSNLMGRIDGIHRLYGMIWERSGHSKFPAR